MKHIKRNQVDLEVCVMLKNLSKLFTLLCILLAGSFLSVNAKEPKDILDVTLGHGMKTYNYTKESSKKQIKITAGEDGIFYLQLSVVPKKGILKDANKKDIVAPTTEKDSYYLKDVKKGTVFYIQIPEVTSAEDFGINTCIYPDNVQQMKDNVKYVQSGKGQYTYKYFAVSKRYQMKLYVSPEFVDYKNHVYVYVQKKEKNKWKTVTNQLKSKANEHGTHEFYIGLKKGSYRLATKTTASQIFEINKKLTKNTSTYQTKKSKAQKISLGKSKTNIYTSTEKASRWYRVSRTSLKKRYVKVNVANNSGKIKVSIYKKGRTKALKSVTLSSDNYNPYEMTGKIKYTYRLKSGKGTYYVKVSKSGSKMNGKYTVQYK